MFEIISYGGGNLLYQILQGVAMFFGSGDYLFTMKIVATMAGLAILVQSAFTGRLPDLKWFLVIIFVYMFAFVPKVTVTVTDTVERSTGFGFSAPMPTVRVVANVPIGLAFVASFTSHMKDYFVRGIETVFALPGEMQYRTAGPLFAQGIAEKTLATSPQNPSTVASLSNFWRDCVFYDIALGFYSMDAISKSDDLEDFLRTNVNNNRFYQHVAADGAQTFVGCRASLQSSGPLKVALDEEKVQQSKWVSWYNNLATKPSASSNNALMTSGAAAMPVAMSYLTGMSITSSRMLGQTILTNSFASGLTSFASQSEAQEVMQSYAAAKAEAERSVTFSTLGKISGRMLPLMNIIAEALIYAVFPIIALFMLWPGGHKAAAAYAMALIWIALWAPMYAIVHFISAFYSSISVGSAAQMCDAANVCQAHLNMYTMRSMKEAFANAAAISGFMATMVPYIAYMVVSKSGAMMAGTVGRLLDGYSQPVSHAAGEAAAGNVSMGSMNYENQSAFQHNTAPGQTSGYMTQSDGRNTHTETQHIGIDQMNLSRGAASMNAASNVQAQLARAQSESTTMTNTAQTSLTEANASRLAALNSAEMAISRSTQTGSGFGHDEKAGSSQSLDMVRSAAHSYAKEAGVSERAMDAAMAKMGVGLGVGVTAGASQEAVSSEEMQKAERVAQQFASSQSFKETLDKAESDYMSRTASYTDGATKAGRESVAAATEKSVQAQEAYTVALARQEAVSRTAQEVQSQGVAAGADMGEYLRQRIGGGEQGYRDFNERVTAGDTAALQQLDEYKNDFAQKYVQSLVNKNTADVEGAAGAGRAALGTAGAASVAAHAEQSTTEVNQERAAAGTTDADAAKIRAEASGRAASATGAVVNQERDLLAPAGQELKGAVEGKVSDSTVDGRVDEKLGVGVVERAGTKAAENVSSVVDSATGAVAGAINAGGQAIRDLPVVGAALDAVVQPAGNLGNTISEAVSGKPLQEHGHDLGVDIAAREGTSGVVDNNKGAWATQGETTEAPNDTAGNTPTDRRPR